MQILLISLLSILHNTQGSFFQRVKKRDRNVSSIMNESSMSVRQRSGISRFQSRLDTVDESRIQMGQKEPFRGIEEVSKKYANLFNFDQSVRKTSIFETKNYSPGMKVTHLGGSVGLSNRYRRLFDNSKSVTKTILSDDALFNVISYRADKRGLEKVGIIMKHLFGKSQDLISYFKTKIRPKEKTMNKTITLEENKQMQSTILPMKTTIGVSTNLPFSSSIGFPRQKPSEEEELAQAKFETLSVNSIYAPFRHLFDEKRFLLSQIDYDVISTIAYQLDFDTTSGIKEDFRKPLVSNQSSFDLFTKFYLSRISDPNTQLQNPGFPYIEFGRSVGLCSNRGIFTNENEPIQRESHRLKEHQQEIFDSRGSMAPHEVKTKPTVKTPHFKVDEHVRRLKSRIFPKSIQRGISDVSLNNRPQVVGGSDWQFAPSTRTTALAWALNTSQVDSDYFIEVEANSLNFSKPDKIRNDHRFIHLFSNMSSWLWLKYFDEFPRKLYDLSIISASDKFSIDICNSPFFTMKKSLFQEETAISLLNKCLPPDESRGNMEKTDEGISKGFAKPVESLKKSPVHLTESSKLPFKGSYQKQQIADQDLPVEEDDDLIDSSVDHSFVENIPLTAGESADLLRLYELSRRSEYDADIFLFGETISNGIYSNSPLKFRLGKKNVGNILATMISEASSLQENLNESRFYIQRNLVSSIDLNIDRIHQYYDQMIENQNSLLDYLLNVLYPSILSIASLDDRVLNMTGHIHPNSMKKRLDSLLDLNIENDKSLQKSLLSTTQSCNRDTRIFESADIERLTCNNYDDTIDNSRHGIFHREDDIQFHLTSSESSGYMDNELFAFFDHFSMNLRDLLAEEHQIVELNEAEDFLRQQSFHSDFVGEVDNEANSRLRLSKLISNTLRRHYHSSESMSGSSSELTSHGGKLDLMLLLQSVGKIIQTQQIKITSGIDKIINYSGDKYNINSQSNVFSIGLEIYDYTTENIRLILNSSVTNIYMYKVYKADKKEGKKEDKISYYFELEDLSNHFLNLTRFSEEVDVNLLSTSLEGIFRGFQVKYGSTHLIDHMLIDDRLTVKPKKRISSPTMSVLKLMESGLYILSACWLSLFINHGEITEDLFLCRLSDFILKELTEIYDVKKGPSDFITIAFSGNVEIETKKSILSFAHQIGHLLLYHVTDATLFGIEGDYAIPIDSSHEYFSEEVAYSSYSNKLSRSTHEIILSQYKNIESKILLEILSIDNIYPLGKWSIEFKKFALLNDRIEDLVHHHLSDYTSMKNKQVFLKSSQYSPEQLHAIILNLVSKIKNCYFAIPKGAEEIDESIRGIVKLLIPLYSSNWFIAGVDIIKGKLDPAVLLSQIFEGLCNVPEKNRWNSPVNFNMLSISSLLIEKILYISLTNEEYLRSDKFIKYEMPIRFPKKRVIGLGGITTEVLKKKTIPKEKEVQLEEATLLKKELSEQFSPEKSRENQQVLSHVKVDFQSIFDKLRLVSIENEYVSLIKKMKAIVLHDLNISEDDGIQNRGKEDYIKMFILKSREFHHELSNMAVGPYGIDGSGWMTIWGAYLVD